MHMRIHAKPLALLSIALAIFQMASSQSSVSDNTKYYNRPQVSSPNAAALEKFVEFPAATYTGVPGISIPMYELNAKGVKIPISISYHAGGVKVDDVASDIGLGWALEAGGTISILNNGLLDEQSGFPLVDTANFNKVKNFSFQTGYTGGVISCNTAMFYADPYPLGPDPYGLYSGGDITFLANVVREQADSEPDLYTFNFLGRTGKFFQDENGIFRTIPYSNLQVQRITENNLPAGYKLTDESGNIYEFKVREESGTISPNCFNSFFVPQNTSRSYCLSKIITSNGSVVDFYYTTSVTEYGLTKQISRARTSPLTDCWQHNNYGEYYYNCETNSSFNSGAKRIDSIKTSDGVAIKFNYASVDRKDVDGAAKALKTVEVWENIVDNKRIRKFNLDHSYFGDSMNSNPNYCRLKLISFQEEGKPATEFDYNAILLPPRLSYSVDHYGYYNQKNNLTILPDDEFHDFFDGADRSVDTSVSRAGILQQVKHPTGGRTEYVYEANEYYVPDTTTIYPKTVGIYKVSVADQTISDTFTVPSNVAKVKIIHNNSYDGTQIHNDYCYINLYGPNSYFRRFLGNSNVHGYDINLTPGNYTLEIETAGSTYSAEATIVWFSEVKVPPHNEPGGGVRVKEIRKYGSDNSLALVNKFEYKKEGTSTSSGVTSFVPTYLEYKDETVDKQNGTSSSSCTSTYCQYAVLNSSSIVPLSFANGSSVVYSEVTSYSKDKTQNGYSHYKYNVDLNGFNQGIVSFPHAPRIPYDWVNGSLLEQKDFGVINSQYKLLKKTRSIYNYTSFNPDSGSHYLYKTYGAKIAAGKSPFICWSPCQSSNVLGTYYSSIWFGIQRYKFYSPLYRLLTTEDTLYSAEADTWLATTINYFYDDAGKEQVSRTRSFSSIGDTLTKKMEYPYHFSGTAVYDTMVARNIIAIPVIETSYRNATLLSTVKTNMSSWHGGTLLLPSTVQTSTLNNPLVTESTFDAYDSKGNIQQISGRNGIKYTYIWDYQSLYPIAEVTDGTGGQVAATSFEADGKGNWSFTGTASVHPSAITGTKTYSLPGGNISISGLSTGTTYTVTYWLRDSAGSASVNGNASTLLATRNGWKLYTHQVTSSTTVTVSGSAVIDELRLYPAGALMTTYTYAPLIGMTSQCDPTGKISYYEYDDFGRLRLIKDQDKNVFKVMDYQYKQTQNQ